MTDAIDIYRAAKLVIDNHREDAVLYAKARTAVLAGEGDAEGAATWLVCGQPPSSYQVSFDSLDACKVARESVSAENKRLAVQSQQKPAGLPANTFYNPGPPLMVSVVCAPQS
jgi:hypothetical protein